MHITIVPNYLLTGIDIWCVHFYVQCRLQCPLCL